MENKKSMNINSGVETIVNDKKIQYKINKYSEGMKETQSLFSSLYQTLYDYYVENKNKFNLQNDIIDKFQILSFISESLKEQLEKIKQFCSKLKLLSPCEIYVKLMNDKNFNEHKNESDHCPICMDNFYEIDINKDFNKLIKEDLNLKFNYNVIVLDDCKDHYFHIDCLIESKGDKNFIRCPICFMIYGEQIGDQPDGIMYAYIDKKLKCSSYEKYDTIIIYYHLPSGEGYTGTKRLAYLPANDQGYEILGLLKVCFDRKLTFKVGTSVTTGKSDTVVWSGIHHKTNTTGGSSSYGFPDEDYFKRVKEEIALRGVLADKLDTKPIEIGKKYIEDCKNIKL